MVLIKKSQTHVGQIFVYLLTLFIVAFVLVFGYKSISNLREKGKEADYLRFKSELESAVKLNKGFGDFSEEAFSIPEGYKEVCFVSSSLFSTTPISCNVCSPTIIKNSVESEVKKNVFLVKNDNEIDSFFVDNIAVDMFENSGKGDGIEDTSNFRCITPTANKLRITFKGKGDKTLISTY